MNRRTLLHSLALLAPVALLSRHLRAADDSTSTVTPLRKTTAVATSTPLLKAMRAATWLAPIMSAISSKVAKATPLRPPSNTPPSSSICRKRE